jgi:hypothetical protein
MIRRPVPHLAAAVLLLGLLEARADEAPNAETLPQPRESSVVMPMPDLPAYYRTNPYDVWQYYAVNRRNQWRPRVAISPYGGAYYMSDGAPYYQLPTQSRNVAPTAIGTPYR